MMDFANVVWNLCHSEQASMYESIVYSLLNLDLEMLKGMSN